nr:DUF3265 domain-containing protein [Vibrio nigripulchritudo]
MTNTLGLIRNVLQFYYALRLVLKVVCRNISISLLTT